MSTLTYYEFILTESYAAAARGIIDDSLQRAKNVKTDITEDEKKELANLRKILKGE